MNSSAGCGPLSAHTLAVDRVARVYSWHGAVYGCSVNGQKSYRLGAAARSISEPRVGPVALAGQDAAYGLTTYGVDTLRTDVVVRRLGNGRELRHLSATTNRLGPESFQSVASLVVKSDSAVAWIGVGGSVISRQRSDTEVHRADTRKAALIDSGSSIDSSSLRLYGSRLTWKDGGQTRSSMLR